MINKRFTIKKKLGEGRSKVFLCTDNESPEKEYAIKVLPAEADENEVKVFRNEFFTLQKLNHPNIIASHEEGVIVENDENEEIKTGSRFIIFDYFSGKDLLSYENLNNEENLKTALTQVCSVLYYLHQSNYIYYDLKPDNILVNKSNGEINIKMIDMGFAHHIGSGDEFLARGTTEYIAPEILKDEEHNHKVDLYSLGIMLYRIVYKKFPFKSDSILEIYKEQIENEFEFPESSYSTELINAIKKLLIKNPVDRYDSVLQLLDDLNIDITLETVKNFTPASIFSDRVEIILQINTLLENENNQEAIIISGVEGAGKTSLIYKIYSTHEKFVFIGGIGRKKGVGFIQYFLKKIVYSEFVYPLLEKDLFQQIDLVLSDHPENLISNLKSIFNRISLSSKFTIIIDNFGFLDEFTLDILKELLPIFQVNRIRIILAERATYESSANKIINKAQEINLTAFTEGNLTEYLDDALATFFPKDELKELIIKYADLLPGSIINFIRDLILLNIIKFTPEGPEIVTGEKTNQLLESSHEEIFRLRLELLTDNEMKIARFISSFNISPELKVISALNRLSIDEVNRIIKVLEKKNILEVSSITDAFNFTSESLKKYIYSSIESSGNFHKEIAESISEKFLDFNRQELARHFELSDNLTASFNILSEEIKEADRLFAYSYKKNILNHLLELPLEEKYHNELSYKLSSTLYKLDDPKSSLEIIEELLSKGIDENIKIELLILKGSCLIGLGELDAGKNILMELTEKINDERKKQKLILEIAYAEFDLNNYDRAERITLEMLSHEDLDYEEKGRAYNLLGLIEIYSRNNFEEALNHFKKALEIYKLANLYSYEVKVGVNIGNIYNMLGDSVNAEKYWSSSLESNVPLGNLESEGKILMNFGILYFNKFQCEKAIEQYNRTSDIFVSLGNRHAHGLSLTNLGEINIDICNYQDAYDSLNKAREIFNKLANVDEEAEVLFLLGKLYYLLGADDETSDIIKSCKEIMTEPTERHKNNIQFLEILSKGNYDEGLIKEIKTKYQELNDRGNYSKSNIFFCEACINNGNYDGAFEAVNEEEFLKICADNYLIKANREFLIGEISVKNEELNLPNPFKCYSTAYEIMENSYITELTWKVLLKLSDLYYERGNFNKINDNIFYAKKILYFIADQVKDSDLKNKYLNRTDRAAAIKRIEFLEKEVS